MPGEFTLKLTGPGINLDQTITEETAQRIVLTAFGSLVPTTPAPVPPRTPPAHAPAHPAAPAPHASDDHGESLAEFVRASGAKRGPDKITAIAHYLRKNRSQQNFTRQDIEQGFVDAGDSVPGNLPRDLKWAVRVGWIAPRPGQRGTYYVTGSGSQTVQDKFPKEAVKKSTLGRNTRRKPKKKTTS